MGTASMHEVRIYGEHEQRVIDQLERCAAVEEGARAVLCADGHLGYSQPIGGARRNERMSGRQPWEEYDLNRKRLVVWQCGADPKHRGWRDESRAEEVGRRGTCDYCLARTAFERELSPIGEEFRAPPRKGGAGVE